MVVDEFIRPFLAPIMLLIFAVPFFVAVHNSWDDMALYCYGSPDEIELIGDSPDTYECKNLTDNTTSPLQISRSQQVLLGFFPLLFILGLVVLTLIELGIVEKGLR